MRIILSYKNIENENKIYQFPGGTGYDGYIVAYIYRKLYYLYIFFLSPLFIIISFLDSERRREAIDFIMIFPPLTTVEVCMLIIENWF